MPLILYTLLFIMATFVLEMIILASRDWKVSRRTPTAKLAYSGGERSFCDVFWASAMIYFAGTAIALIIGAYLSGFLSLVLGMGGETEGIFIAITGVMVIVAIFFYLVEVLPGQIRRAARSSDTSSKTSIARGVSNWYTQVKEKFCPVIGKEED